MTVTAELREIKDMLGRIIRDMTKIRQTQKRMKEEMYEIRDDLKRFRDLWQKEKADIENRLQKLEEDKIKRELVQRLLRLEKMEEAIEMKEKKSNSNIKAWEMANPASLHTAEIHKRIESIAKKEQNYATTSNLEHNKLCINEKNMILKDGQRLIKQFFGGGKADL